MSANPVRLAARLRKLQAMSAAEIAHRSAYRLVLASERREHGTSSSRGDEALGESLVRHLRGPDWRSRLLAARRASPARFFAGTTDRDEMLAIFRRHFRGELEDMASWARCAREQRFEFFGLEFHYAGEIDWQADPVTGRRWPSVYHADVPVHAGDVGFGDVKHVWELNRQQYLIDLAKAFWLNKDGDSLAAVRRIVHSWLQANPYGTGVNWSCALEPAFRAWSWLWAYHLTAAGLDDAFHVEWLRGFQQHATFLSRHLELYSSPYNHLIGEASALYAIGACFPEFRQAAAWCRRARAVLEGRLVTQFYSDGGSVEQSTFYHHATTGFYLLSLLLARANGAPLSPMVERAVERAMEFSMYMMQPDGRTPAIGGADDGKPIRMEHLPFWDFRPYLAIGAVLFRRADLKRAAGRFFEDALWLLGPAGFAAFEAVPAVPSEISSVVLPSSGYVVGRTSWDGDADYVCFDVGEQAAGMRSDGVPNSMHGHADCLSLIVCLRGRPVLVDAGLYAYNCGGDWEAHFRETAAHNTATVDGRDQARHIGKMAWSHSYRAALEAWSVEAGQCWATGSHDGYARGSQGVTHRRTVWLRPPGYVLVLDEFSGRGAHEIAVNYQFAPGELRLAADGHAAYGTGSELAWIAPEPWRAELRCGGEAPADGWICSSLGVRAPAPKLTLRTRATEGTASLLVVLVPETCRVRTRAEGLTRMVWVEAEGWVDVIAARGVSAGSPLVTDARLAVCRWAISGELERAIVQGTYVEVDAAAMQRLVGCPAGMLAS